MNDALGEFLDTGITYDKRSPNWPDWNTLLADSPILCADGEALTGFRLLPARNVFRRLVFDGRKAEICHKPHCFRTFLEPLSENGRGRRSSEQMPSPGTSAAASEAWVQATSTSAPRSRARDEKDIMGFIWNLASLCAVFFGRGP